MDDLSDTQTIDEIRQSIIYLRTKNQILLECLKKYDKWRDDIIKSTNAFFDVSITEENKENEENKTKT